MSRAFSSIATSVAASLVGLLGGCSLVSLDDLSVGAGGGASSSDAASSGPTSSVGSGAPSSVGSGQQVTDTAMSASASVATGGGGGDGGAASTSSVGEGGQGAAGGGGAGGGIVTSPCTSTPLLDNFDRPDGPLGEPWLEDGGLQIHQQRVENVLEVKGYSRAEWAQPFGADQEAHVVLSHIDLAGEEQLLLMKIQDDANIEVLYSPEAVGLEVWTCTPSCNLEWEQGLIVRDGAQLAARATADGFVKVCLDGELIDTVDVRGWAPYYENGGRIGVGAVREEAQDPPFAFDDFGGGDVNE